MALIKLLRAALAGGPYYIRLRRNRLIVRNASTGAEFNDEPLIALSDARKPQVLAVGAASRGMGSDCTNPFQHPRIILADFFKAEAVLKYAFHAVTPHSWISPSPIAVCHVLERLDGGLSQIECRALMELMEGAGARRSYIWEGSELSDAELLSGVYQPAGE